MQQEPAAAPSSGSQEDSALPHAPTMPPPESASESREPSPDHSPTEVRLGLGRRRFGCVNLLRWERRCEGRGNLAKDTEGRPDPRVLTFLAPVGVGESRQEEKDDQDELGEPLWAALFTELWHLGPDCPTYVLATAPSPPLRRRPRQVALLAPPGAWRVALHRVGVGGGGGVKLEKTKLKNQIRKRNWRRQER